MSSISSVRSKIADLKAKVEQSSISPLLLGSILDEMVDLVNIVDPSSIRIIPAADSVRISFSVDGSPSTIIIPAVSDLAAGVITPDQINSIRKEIADAVTAAKTPAISIEQLDTMGTDGSAAALRALVRGAAHHTRYRVKDNIYSAATLDITSDSMGHLLTQILTSHYSLGPDGQPDFSTHDDNAIHTLWRSFNIDAPSFYPVPKGQWSRWQELTPAGLEQRTAALEQSASDLGNRTAAVEKAVASIPVPPKVYPFDGIWDSGSLPTFGVWYRPGEDRFYCSTLRQGYHDSDYNNTVGIDSSRRIARRDCLFTCDGDLYAWEESLGRLVAQSELHRRLSSAIETESGRITELEDIMQDLAIKQFILLWEEACTYKGGLQSVKTVGCYNYDTKLFELNGITDITFAEAIRIYNAYVGQTRLDGCRTNLPFPPASHSDSGFISSLLTNASKLEVFWGDVKFYSQWHYAQNLGRLREIRYVNFSKFYGYTFQGAYRLATISDITITGKGTLNLSPAPLLTIESVATLINASPAGNTLQFHPDVYAKLTGDISNDAAAAITGDELKEWMALLDRALANNITIAC